MHTFLNSPTQELFLYIITMFPNAFLLPFTVAQDLQSDLILRSRHLLQKLINYRLDFLVIVEVLSSSG